MSMFKSVGIALARTSLFSVLLSEPIRLIAALGEYNLAYFIELLTIALLSDRNDFAMVPLGVINMKR